MEKQQFNIYKIPISIGKSVDGTSTKKIPFVKKRRVDLRLIEYGAGDNGKIRIQTIPLFMEDLSESGKRIPEKEKDSDVFVPGDFKGRSMIKMGTKVAGLRGRKMVRAVKGEEKTVGIEAEDNATLVRDQGDTITDLVDKFSDSIAKAGFAVGFAFSAMFMYNMVSNQTV